MSLAISGVTIGLADAYASAVTPTAGQQQARLDRLVQTYSLSMFEGGTTADLKGLASQIAALANQLGEPVSLPLSTVTGSKSALDIRA